MCRVGGRRCPGEHDPAVKEARNARRRAKYAADKAAGKPVSKRKKKSVSNEPVSTQPTLEQKQENLSENAPILQTKMDNEEKQVNTIEPKTGKKVSENLLLGVETFEDERAKELDSLYQGTTIKGKIYHRNLDKDSYKDFGFEKPQVGWLNSKGDTDTTKLSETETENITPDQQFALRVYTSQQYGWINACAYDPKKIDKEPLTVQPNGGIEGFEVDELFTGDPYGGNYYGPESHSKSLLKRTTDEIDAALASGEKHQRIVYRSISESEVKGSPKAWVRKNRAIGTEVEFPAYTSTTMRPNIVAGFGTALKHRVIYQILTPEGAAVSKQSSHPGEDEVLLPRNQRYMVVGVHEDVALNSWERGTFVQMVAINSKGEILDGTNADPIEPLVTDEMLKEK